MYLCMYATQTKAIQLHTLVHWQSYSGWCHCIPVVGLENIRVELHILHLDAVVSGRLRTECANYKWKREVRGMER